MSRIVGEVMETLLLKKPTLEIKNDALDYKDEHLQNGETELHGAEDEDTHINVTLATLGF